MPRKKLPFQEGAWFAVPLRTNGFAVGIVARMDGDGCVFGYFYGPKRASVPTLEALVELRPSDAVWQGRFGDLGMLNGEWPIISRDTSWDRDEWPLPPFVRVDVVSGEAVVVTYSDSLEHVGETPCDPALADKYPYDGLAGYGAVEIILTKLLDAGAKS